METLSELYPEEMTNAEERVFTEVAFSLPYKYGYSPTMNYMVWHKRSGLPVSGRDYPSMKEAAETDTINRLVPNFVYRLKSSPPPSAN